MAKRTLITSALPYVNNMPHLGTLVCVINADIYARFLRLKKQPVLSVLGTDEHGSTTEVKAVQEGKTPQEITDLYFAEHKKIYEWFNTSFDCFGRTSSPENHQTAQEIFKHLDTNGYITSHTTSQLYDKQAQRFLPDRFVEGTCPKCGYTNARGDQCDGCGSLLDSTDLINPKSIVTQSTPELRDSTHLFLDLAKLQPQIEEWVEKHKQKWTQNAAGTTKHWLNEGLKERCITRDLSWGVQVPKEGYTNKVFYSWFDAPIGYISIVKESDEDWQHWWQQPDDVELVQFMGKDNIVFHSIWFPALLMGTKQPYTLVSRLAVNEFLNYKGGKFSKSRGTGVFGDDAMHSGIPADAYRFYLASIFPDREDTVFDWDDFGAKYNNELIANIANLVNRTLTFVGKFHDNTLPHSSLEPTSQAYQDIEKHYGNIDPKNTMKAILQFSKHWNTYFQHNKPWELIKNDKAKCEQVISVLVHAVRDLAILIQPIMPATAANINEQLNIGHQFWQDLGTPLPAEHKLGTAKPLFQKLDDKQISEFKGKFSEGKKESHLNHLELTVGKILKVEPHPDADKLFIEQLDMGGSTRQIVSGLRSYYSEEELVGKHVVVITNLRPATIRGVKSEGMLLAAENKKDVGVIEAPNSSPGSSVFGKQPHTPAAKEITIDDVAKVTMIAKDNRVLADDEMLQTDSETLSVDKGIDGKVR